MQMTLIDKAVAYLNPAAGLKRFQKKNALEIMKRGFEGARKDRRTEGWRITNDAVIDPLDELELLKKRSRDLYRNNPYAYNAHNSIADNTTGTGILPAIKDNNLKKVWRNWAESIKADFDQNLNFYGLQNLCMRTLSMHGGVLVLRVKTRDNTIPLELKVVTTKFLDHFKDTVRTAEGGFVKGGVEFDNIGKRKGYWIFPQDPTLQYGVENPFVSTFWKEEDVIHLFKVEEPGQIHGIPFGSASIMALRDFDDYADAQLMRQKIAACFSVFITKTDSEIVSGAPEDRMEKLEPGLIEHLDPGKNVTFAAPPAAEGYGEYSRNVLSSVASGFGMSYESMTGDLKGVNFSSGRMGWLEYQRKIENWQEFILIPKLCGKVWIWFVEAGVLSGKIPKNTSLSIDWTAPGRTMIDPVKEVAGLEAQVRAGFMSWQEAVRKLGYAPEEILEEMKLAAKDFDEAGLKPSSDPRFDAGKQAVTSPLPTADETEDGQPNPEE